MPVTTESTRVGVVARETTSDHETDASHFTRSSGVPALDACTSVRTNKFKVSYNVRHVQTRHG